jgi:hypothetical protein
MSNATLVEIVGGGTAGTPSGGVVTVQSPGSAAKTATIANGASLSSAVDLGAGAVLAGIQMPASWTTASLAFQVSNDGSTYQVLRVSGAEFTVSSGDAAASLSVGGLQSYFYGWRYVKLQSGSSSAPVNQGGARSVVLVAAS